MVGPPCETWSVARGKGSGPRRVRSAQHPWSIPGLSRAEQDQVDLANKLLRAALFLFAACLQAGAPAIREHP
eukprot:9347831-Lingulodinium_polyedra.AAC.1